MKNLKYLGIALIIFGAVFAILYLLKPTVNHLLSMISSLQQFKALKKRQWLQVVIPEDELRLNHKFQGL